MCEWISVTDGVPIKPGGAPSDPMWVQAYEFDFPPVFYVARCFWSTLDGQEPTWFMDPVFYNLDRPFMIAAEVTHWMPLPKPAEVLPLFRRISHDQTSGSPSK